jgi:hypothetical protein
VMLNAAARVLSGPLYDQLAQQTQPAVAPVDAAVAPASAPVVPSMFTAGLSLVAEAAANELGAGGATPTGAAADHKSPIDIVKSSFVGTLVPTLITSLCGRVHDAEFVSTLLPELVPLIQRIDKLGALLPQTARSEKVVFSVLMQKQLNGSGDFALRTMSSLHWTLDLEKGLANLTGQSLTTLVKGAPTTEDENQHRKWLDSELLSSGLDDTPTGLEVHRREFLGELINLPSQAESEASVLAAYMHRHITAKKPLASIGGDIGTHPPPLPSPSIRHCDWLVICVRVRVLAQWPRSSVRRWRCC